MKPVIVAGAGLTGLSCAMELDGGCRIFEKEERPGGLCRTNRFAGYTIDLSGHYLHFRDAGIRSLVFRLLRGNLISRRRDSWVRLKGIETPYPFQANLKGHSPVVVRECVLGMMRAVEKGREPDAGASYGEWIRSIYGEGFARHFMVPFNEKQFVTSVERLVPEQGGRFLPRPQLEEVIRGAVGIQRSAFGYNVLIWHPRRGGIEALVEAMAGRLVAPLSTGTAVERVLWKRRSVLLGDGRVVPYDVLVSTMPLPDLLQRLDPPVAALGVAARKLRWTGTLTVHFCVRRPRERRRHWFYVPERRYAFYRYGFPSNINPVTVPRGFGVVSAEVSYVSGRRPADSQVTRRCARQLRELGVLGPERDVVRTMVADFPVAYVVFDRDHDRARMAALRFLAGAGIISTGRYGGWTYGGMEDAIRDGQAAAASIRAHGRRAPIRFLEGRA